MISNIFFNNKDYRVPEYQLSDDYIVYLIIQYFFKSKDTKRFSIANIELYLKHFYSDQAINRSELIRLVNKYLPLIDDELSFNKSRFFSIIKSAFDFNDDFLISVWDSSNYLMNQIFNETQNYLFNFSKVLLFRIALHKVYNPTITDDFCSFTYFNALVHKDEIKLKIDQAFYEIDSFFANLKVNVLIEEKDINDLLLQNSLYTLNDIQQVSASFKLIIFLFNIDLVLTSLHQLSSNKGDFVNSLFNNTYGKISPKQYDILAKRYGLDGLCEHTLEEVGREKKLTRERVRQIEKKGLEYLKENIANFEIALPALFYSLIQDNDCLLEIDKFKGIINENKVKNLLLLFEISKSNIVYNESLGILYDKSKISIKQIEDELIMKSSAILYSKDFIMLKNYEQRIISSLYKNIDNKVWVRKELGKNYLIEYILDTYFANGYCIGSDVDYSLFKQHFDCTYGVDNNLSKRYIQAVIDRTNNYCQIDRGKYKNYKFCPSIPPFLMSQIINFILRNKPMVFYSTIFDKFSVFLKDLGIDNYFFLKGLIDKHLPDNMHTKRNYIQIDSNISSNDYILSYIKQFNGVFTFKELEDKFAGVQPYTIFNILYQQKENGLIWLNNRKFVYFDKLIINSNVFNDIEAIIKDLTININVNFLTTRKLFANLAIFHNDILGKLPNIDGSFSLFSLLQWKFKDKYFFNRPFIYLSKDDMANSSTDIVYNYIEKLDSFNSNTVSTFISRMNMRPIYSYLDLMENMSDQFIQVSIDEMIKKDKFNFESIKTELDRILNLIFDRTDKIDTRSFNGYSMLPRFNYSWNKYLLAGIIRGYYSDRYTIENTDTFYNKTDFIIRRIGK